MKGGSRGNKHKICMLYFLFISILFSLSISGERTTYVYHEKSASSSAAPPPPPCSKDDLEIDQGPMPPPLPSGIRTYGVVITNNCVTNCTIANIHVSCGWFNSTTVVDPTIFRRLSYNDCLANDGKSLDAGKTLDFQYANSFPYPLQTSSFDCCYD